MVFIPWSYVNLWRCNGCGICCKEFEVVLTFNEWLYITKKYGVGVTKTGLNKFFMGKRADGSCVFLYPAPDGKWLCGLQNNKPLACKLWPFKILNKPTYSEAKEALFEYNGQKFYVYVDQFCPGIRFGLPSAELVYKIIPEFIEIALGIRQKQVYSTMRASPNFYIIKMGRNWAHRLI
ncbi:MAG: YkgJ family cysteine cluster protein [Candidatus Bathyarchaeia archaeon]|nr:YkgJ family cysteine cluster protein [Candidatus Bathyarchaeota archaeon]